MKKQIFKWIGLLGIILIANGVLGQGWQNIYPMPDSGLVNMGEDIFQTVDGGYVAVGGSFGLGNYSLTMVKLQPNGEALWTKTYRDSTRGFAGGLMPDNGYIAGGTYNEFIYLLKTNSQGEFEWDYTGNQGRIYDIQVLNDGSIITGGYKDAVPYAGKFDVSGNLLWEYQYEDPIPGIGGRVQEIKIADNGEIYLLASWDPDGTSITHPVIYHLDANGILINSEYHDSFAVYETKMGLELLSNGNLAIAALFEGNIAGFAQAGIIILNSNGAYQTHYFFGTNLIVLGFHDVVETPDGGLIAFGFEDYNDSPIGRAHLALRVDANGNELWRQTYGFCCTNSTNRGIATSDGGYALVGRTNSGPQGPEAYVAKINADGYLYSNVLYGNVYEDLDFDCLKGGIEEGVTNIVVEAEGTDYSFYGLSDSLGNYEIQLDTGSYNIKINNANPYWNICNNNFSLDIVGFYNTYNQDFGFQLVVDCPYLTTDIGTPFLRRCFDNIYTVSYCNDGADMDTSAVIEVTLDPLMTFVSSTLPPVNSINNIYYFDVGMLESWECGSFDLTVYLDCDSTILGQTHCVESHIYPDSICLPANALWDGSSIEVEGVCVGDSVHFNIRNIGDGDMSDDGTFLVVEDHIILKTGMFKLESGEDTTIVCPADGLVVRMEASQAEGHPGQSMPSVTIESCTDNPFAQGIFNQFSQDDADYFVSIDCQENIGAFDPNDKQGFPTGYGDEHFIEPNQYIEYKIRFQNTGTDTAFLVVIRDTISEDLDIETLQLGASSHDYTFDISPGNVFVFTYNNIMLPDSNVNELRSHGFVKFKIKPKTTTPLGTVINNSAAIYFDYNAPVITNETKHTLGENFVEIFVDTHAENVPEKSAEIKVFPNPFTEEATIEILSYKNKIYELTILDTVGRTHQIQETNSGYFNIKRENLSTGIYFFQIRESGQVVQTGKMVVR